MAGQLWFYRGEDEWIAVFQRLQRNPCPHCKVIGSLIQHGFLYGFDDSSPPRRTRRARRIFCSNRNLRPGCGRTFSVWLADKVRRLSLSAHTLWDFLQRAVAASIAAAIRAATCQRCERTWRRLWKRFVLAQSGIRTALATRCPPPLPPPRPSRHTEAQTLAHLQAAFPNDNCPIASFQLHLRSFFI
jgi:hypothetical protein